MGKAFFALFMAMLFALACLTPTSFATAWADGGGNEENPPSEPPFSSFYYFSDSGSCQSYYNSFTSAQNYTESGLYDWCSKHYEDYENIRNAEFFESQLRDYYDSNDWKDVDDAYVVFEMKYGFSQDCLDQLNTSTNFPFLNNTPLLTTILKNIFSAMKENGCEIMFVCGTDEVYFIDNNRNEFLDFVDIHVNTDIFYTFFSTICYFITHPDGLGTEDQPPENITLIFNANISNGIDTEIDTPKGTEGIGYFVCSFFKSYLLPFFLKDYRDEISPEDIDFGNDETNSEQALLISIQNGMQEILNNHNIKIFCHLQDTTYYNAVAETTVEFTALSYDMFANDRIFAIGQTVNGQGSQTWLNQMQDLRTLLNDDFPIYLYFTSGYNAISDTTDPISEFYKAGSTLNTVGVTNDFLDGQNMSSYDNWFGRCTVTHKLLASGSGGWLMDVYGLFEYRTF